MKKRVVLAAVTLVLVSGCSHEDLTGVQRTKAPESIIRTVPDEGVQNSGMNKCGIYRNELCPIK
jgi:hypothetical protein